MTRHQLPRLPRPLLGIRRHGSHELLLCRRQAWDD